ncbi:hypothetical protein SALBM217S_06417 [Streptomyces griseoloalbus]
MLVRSATSLSTVFTRSRSSSERTVTSTLAVAQPCERFPIRLTSPLRTYQISPSAPRSFVTRSPTSITSPVATPASTVSPTPYWSSRIMKTPERKSVTRLRAPKPIATPATPADASSGARLIWKVPSTISAAVPMIRKDATERSTEPIAMDRCRRRSALTSRPPSPPPSSAWPVRDMRSTSLVMARRTSTRSTVAITRISSTRNPMASHVDQFSSTQPAALVALSWASWSDGTRGVPDSAGVGEGSAAHRAADKDTAGTSRCTTVPGAAVKACEITNRSPVGTEPPH